MMSCSSWAMRSMSPSSTAPWTITNIPQKYRRMSHSTIYICAGQTAEQVWVIHTVHRVRDTGPLSIPDRYRRPLPTERHSSLTLIMLWMSLGSTTTVRIVAPISATQQGLSPVNGCSRKPTTTPEVT